MNRPVLFLLPPVTSPLFFTITGIVMFKATAATNYLIESSSKADFCIRFTPQVVPWVFSQSLLKRYTVT